LVVSQLKKLIVMPMAWLNLSKKSSILFKNII